MNETKKASTTTTIIDADVHEAWSVADNLRSMRQVLRSRGVEGDVELRVQVIRWANGGGTDLVLRMREA